MKNSQLARTCRPNHFNAEQSATSSVEASAAADCARCGAAR